MNRRINFKLRNFIPFCIVSLGLASINFASEPATQDEFESSIATAYGEKFENSIKPILADKCFSCHADGATEGSFSFDALMKEGDEHERNKQWHRVLKQLQADLMPPREEVQPSDGEVHNIIHWIKDGAFKLDPENPNPGKVTVRRLNRVEYRNTIRDLIGIDYDTNINFPADDTGHGFDNIGDVLSISPLLLEKYVNAANDIISRAVPTTSAVPQQRSISGSQFSTAGASDKDERNASGQLELSYYESKSVEHKLAIDTEGDYVVEFDFRAIENYVDNVFDLNKCELAISIDGQELLRQEFSRQNGKKYTFAFPQNWKAGEHNLQISIKPTTESEKVRNLRMQVNAVKITGPNNPMHFVKPDGYDRFFPKSVPEDSAERREYAKDLLSNFSRRAYRRPVDDETLSRLVSLTDSLQKSGQSFEQSIASAMTAVIASPRFIFREEFAATDSQDKHPLIDEYSLASRLSYFLWSSTPDDELLKLAEEGQLRANLQQQVNRMLKDKKSDAFYENLVGQWLQARAIESIQINARSVLRREQTADPDADKKRQRFIELSRKGDQRTEEENKEFELVQRDFRGQFGRGPRIDLTNEVRRAMKQESELLLKHVIDNELSLLDLINGKYTFLNEPLAKHYQIDGVEGNEMRKVDLPNDSVRGGILTTGTFLAVTSNPDRTSPVKRGLFILENILGTPTGAPPPDVPALEEGNQGRPGSTPKLSLRESLAIHRENPTCSSCHNRMDPLGLAFENFNAMGRYRESELGHAIDASGTLVTGESFTSVNELKDILASTRKYDFFRCMTDKMLTYALGRAMEYEDVQTIDTIVEKLDAENGKATTLLLSVIESEAFQRMQAPPNQQSDIAKN